MSLRRKIIIIHIAIFFSLLFTQFLLSRYFTLQGFATIEIKELTESLDRAENAVQGELETLEEKTSDWSAWDDTYQFVQDKNERYVESNLTDSALTGLNINFMIFLDTKNNVVITKSIDLESGSEIQLSSGLLGIANNYPQFVTHASSDSVYSGIINDEGRFVMLDSRPITKSSGEGPIMGSVIFGRYLDEQLVRELELASLESISVIPLNRIDDPEAEKAYRALHEPGTSTFIVENSAEGTIAGYRINKDIEDRDLFMLSVDRGRDVLQYGMTTINLSISSIIIIGLVFGIILIFLFERTVSAPLDKLIKSMESITSSKDLSQRVPVENEGEMATLAININKLLETINVDKHVLEKQNVEIETRNQDTDQLNRTLMGREEKMIELKKEIEELKAKIPTEQPLNPTQ